MQPIIYKLLFTFLMSLACTKYTYSFKALVTITVDEDSSSIISDGAKLQLISNQFSFTEGPAVDRKGNIFFTDQPNDKIWKYGTDGKLSVFLDKTGRSNGLYFHKRKLLACADEKNELWSISRNKKIKVLLKD